MTNKRNWIATLSILAGLSVLGATATAVAIPSDDATILIDRALNSPTLTVRYNGVQASMIELKINGTSIGTRAVEAATKRGETTFTLDPSLLADGENEIEVRLFDKAGRVVGTQKSTITADDGSKGPVFMVSPKVGASILGPVEIKVGFGKELRNTYVSFFVNGQFKSMTNTAPYSFIWDTTREAHGWHEVEAWVVDDTSATYKTRKVRVFVDNVGGRTNRIVTPKVEPKPVAAPAASPANAAPANPKPVKTTPAPAATPSAATPAVAPTVAPGVSANNDVIASVGAPASLKPIEAAKSVSMGSRSIAPKIVRATVAPTTVVKATPSTVEIKVSSPKVTPSVAPKAAPIMIERGTRLPITGTFGISLNSAPVYFDVQPRVQDGIPLTPFRALFEQAGGKVDWENLGKAITATGMGKEVFIKVGDKMARVNKIDVSLEIAPFIERGRTIVPLSFIREGLDVDVQYDAATGHVLITSKKG